MTPHLYYQDVEAALLWLARAYGLSELPGETIRDCEGAVLHAVMTLGDDRVMLGCPGPDYRGPAVMGAVTQSLHVYVPDVHAHHARARESGATILSTPEPGFGGDLRYATDDCEGHRWYFAQRA